MDGPRIVLIPTVITGITGPLSRELGSGANLSIQAAGVEFR